MKKKLGTTLRLTAGVVLLILGVIGSLLPVLQGWIFFLLAALMFFPNHPRAEKGLQKLEPRMPRMVARLRRMGFGRTDDQLANLDVGVWVHEHSPLHLDLHRHQLERRENDTRSADRPPETRER